MQAELLLTVKEVAQMRRRSIASTYRDIERGILPPPVKIGGSSRWPQSEIIETIEAAKAARTRTK